MLPRRRLLVAVALAGIIALPAGVLAGLCVGNACRREDRPRTRVPFCSLPEELRAEIARGFYDGRSPHVLAVQGVPGYVTPVWPALDSVPAEPVPLVFAGTGVERGAEIPSGTTLDAVAPTLAEIIGLHRPHPGVRSGQAIPGIASEEHPRLVIVVVWKGVSTSQLNRQPARWPVLRGLVEDGAATMDSLPGSLPLDPAAILTTIGTGALPRDHGITGAFVRDDQGRAVRAWSEDAPFSVVAALGDDLDELQGQTPLIGIVESKPTDQGLIGGAWYIENDQDDVVIARGPARQAEAAESLLSAGYGSDDTTDLLAVSMDGRVPELDGALGRILTAAEAASAGSYVLAVTSTEYGSDDFHFSGIASDVARAVSAQVVEGVTAGGFFLDQQEMTKSGLSDDRVVAAVRAFESDDGGRLYADVFPSIAVTFARYC
jgi:hypothetical protein